MYQPCILRSQSLEKPSVKEPFAGLGVLKLLRIRLVGRGIFRAYSDRLDAVLM